jgi:membrane peptidoglycan carboxypeptidase
VAGKPGTTKDKKASWYVGYTEQLSTAVALFRVNPKDQGLLPLTGSKLAALSPTDVWTHYMSAATS